MLIKRMLISLQNSLKNGTVVNTTTKRCRMILTVTMNPSIDISYPLDVLQLDTVNRVTEVSKTAGGKGLNVTRVLSEIQDPVAATGLLGGRTGQFILDHLGKGIEERFFEIAGDTRNCIAILHEGKQTEILEKGPTISEKEGQDFLDHYRHLVEQVEVVAFLRVYQSITMLALLRLQGKLENQSYSIARELL